MNPGTCIHYDYRTIDQTGCCKAGVCYRDRFDGSKPGIDLRAPCHQFSEKRKDGMGTALRAGEEGIREPWDRRGQVEIPCDLLRLPTDEEVQSERRETDAYFDRIKVAMIFVSQWRVKPKPTQSRQEVVTCPTCGGRLHLAQSAYNGHCRGQCETPDCVSFIE